MMEDYKRLTERDLVGICVNTYELANEVKKWQERHGIYGYMGADTTQILLERLAEIEDKIENGTLVEFPRVIHPNRAEWFVQYQYPNGVIQYHICFSEAEAEAKLRELKGERECQ